MVDVRDVRAESTQVSGRPVRLGLDHNLEREAQHSSHHHTRQDFILRYLPLVESIARRLHGSLPPNALFELHDLAQTGVVGLVSAGRSYDPAAAVPFSVYARYRIEGEILDSLRRHDPAPRNVRRWQKQVSAACEELAATLKRQPTEEELCERLMVSCEELRSRNLDLNGTTAPAPLNSRDGRSCDPASRPDTHPDQICAQRQLSKLLDRLIESLPVRRRRVIELHYRGHMSMKEVAGILGVTESRASQIHRSALGAMARMLKDSGITSTADI